MLELLFLLLPIAAGYGWFMGRNSVKQKDQRVKQNLSIKYSTGINYLLSNQQDKALDYLVETLSVEDDSIEAHFAMANLFRRRGELDRALKVHEFLVRQDNISNAQKQRALFELAKDFFSAGLYDRAEHIFLKLIKTKGYGVKALTFLLQIYQSTKDWSKGLELESIVTKSKDKKLLHFIANFYCELATLALAKDEFIETLELLEKALVLDSNSCRANFLMAKIYENHSQYREACLCYQEIYQQDKEFFPEVIQPMEFAYGELGLDDDFAKFIKSVYEQTASSSSLIKYTSVIEKKHGQAKATSFVLSALRHRPTIAGFKHFIKMQMVQPNANNETLEMIKELISAYMNLRPRYSCRSCGFNTNMHYWSCPSCHDFEQIKPVRGFEGE